MKRTQTPWLLLLPLTLAALLLTALLVGTQPARATATATCQVPSAGHPTLQAALNDAACDVVALGSQSYLESALSVSRRVTLQGNGAATTIIDANSANTILHALPAADLTLRDLTLREGRSYTPLGPGFGSGGALVIAAGARVTLIDSVLEANQSDNSGGAILNAGRLTAEGTTFHDNRTLIGRRDHGGGAIANGAGGNVTLTNSTLSANSTFGDGGGAIFNQAALTLTASTLLTNTANGAGVTTGRGGAIYQIGISATLHISASQLDANVAGDSGGAIYAEGALALSDNVLRANRTGARGGAIYLTDGRLTSSSNTFNSNQATFGGGALFLNSSRATLNGNQLSTNRAGSDTTDGGLGGALALVNTQVTFADSALQDNRAGLDGGAVWGIASQLALTDTRISGNQSTGALGRGGGVYLLQTGTPVTLTMLRGTVVNNQANHGGGLYIDGGQLTLTNSTLARNTAGGEGGGVWARNQTVAISGGSVTRNTAATTGGGLRLFNARLTLAGTHILSNTANLGGGLFIDGNGHSTLTRLLVGHNQAEQGGGIFNTRPLTLTRSAVYANRATTSGGGLFNSGSTRLTNSTLSQNTAPTAGGIHNISSELRLDGVTLAFNDSGGLQTNGGFVALARSILAGNAGGNCLNVGGVLSSNGHNLASDNRCNLGATGDQPATAARLGPLADYGGDTLTHNLLAGSPALDAIPPADCLAVDQRGVSRPVGTACDIGAFESDTITVAFAAPTLAAYEENGSATIEVVLNRPTPKPVTVSIAVSGGTAQAADYTLGATVITIAAGQQRGALPLTIVDDGQVENAETLILTLQNPANAQLGEPAAQTVTIYDNDRGRIDLQPVQLAPSAESTSATVTLTLAAALAVPVQVELLTRDGSALAGRDYVALTRSVAFAPGVTAVPVTVTLLRPITTQARDFFIVLRNPQGPTIGNAEARVLLPARRNGLTVYLPILRVPSVTGGVPLPDE